MTERADVQANPVSPPATPAPGPHPPLGTLHHVELWVPNLARATAQWGWLIVQLGYTPFRTGPTAAAGASATPTSSSRSHPP